MRSVPASVVLPSQLLGSPVWAQFFSSLLGATAPLSESLYKSNGLLTYTWALAFRGIGNPPFNAPIVDDNYKVSSVWLNYMTLLP